jgi:hypothetical protein
VSGQSLTICDTACTFSHESGTAGRSQTRQPSRQMAASLLLLTAFQRPSNPSTLHGMGLAKAFL